MPDCPLPLTRLHLCAEMTTEAKSNVSIVTNLDTSLWIAERRSVMKKRKRRRKKKKRKQGHLVAVHQSLSMCMYR